VLTNASGFWSFFEEQAVAKAKQVAMNATLTYRKYFRTVILGK